MQDELHRLGVRLGDPSEVARAYAHRLNAEHHPDDHRLIPAPLLVAYADRYREHLDDELPALLASPEYAALTDYRKRLAIRDLEADAQATADAVYRHRFLEGAVRLTWTAEDGELSEYWWRQAS